MDINLNIPKGKYVAAISGGVDSIVLLDLLSKTPDLDLVVAHFNHGIRKDSGLDEQLVKQMASKLKTTYESKKVELGQEVSEAEAREARYKFLSAVKNKHKADAIITAHHQDDVIETSIINILRGTNRRGLTALRSRKDIIRPLLIYPKSELIKYALDNGLKWREDSTNKDKKYLRNKVRLEIVAQMDAETRVKWLKILDSNERLNIKIDGLVENLLRKGLHKGQPVLNRQWFAQLPHLVSKEVISYIVYKLGIKDVDKKTIERISVQIKTLPAGKTIQAVGFEVKLTKRSARFIIKAPSS